MERLRVANTFTENRMHSGGPALAVGSTGHHLSDGRPVAASLRKRLPGAGPPRVESRQPPGPERDSPRSYTRDAMPP